MQGTTKLPIEDGLAGETRAFEQVKSGSATFEALIWCAESRAYVAPRSMRKQLEAAFEEANVKGQTCLFRQTGGDLVPQGPDVLNYTICWNVSRRTDQAITHCYEMLGAPLISALRNLGVDGGFGSIAGSYCDGDHNVTVGAVKLAGTALRMSPSKSNKEHWAVLGHVMVPIERTAIEALDHVNALYTAAGLEKAITPGAAVCLEDLNIDADILVAALRDEIEVFRSGT